MRARCWILAALAATLAAAPARAQSVGMELDKVALTDLARTQAKTWDDFAGRLVLIEFFAYW